jgi:hypothetical protein
VDEWVAFSQLHPASQTEGGWGGLDAIKEDAPMSSTSSDVSVFKPTNALSQVFGEPTLVGLERLEVYNEFLSMIASAIKPTDSIGWLLTKDVADLAWDIRRERIIKAEIIKHYQKEVVAELIKLLAPAGQFSATIYRIFQADDDLTLWETDPEARLRIDKALATKGHSASAILAQAYMRGATQIDAIDRRIANYERRRNTALREAGFWNEGLLRRLDQATSEVIDAEFSDVVEKQ